MDDATRRKVAFTVANKMGAALGAVYSHHNASHTHISGNGNSMYDYGSGSHFSDSYDYGRSAHWNLNISGENFSGYDYGFGQHFSGQIRGRNVSIYDYGTGQHYSYTI
jgi:hypothetical protein